MLKCFWVGLEGDKIEDNAEEKCLSVTKFLNFKRLQEIFVKLVQESSFLVLTACGSKVLDTIFLVS